MVKIAKELKNKNYRSQIVSQIHDELIVKVYEDEKDQVTALVKEIMENVYNFACPLLVDGQLSKTWFDAK